MKEAIHIASQTRVLYHGFNKTITRNDKYYRNLVTTLAAKVPINSGSITANLEWSSNSHNNSNNNSNKSKEQFQKLTLFPHCGYMCDH
jgi:hypothetical protein